MTYLQQLLIICPLIFISGFIDSIAGGGGLISITAYYLAGLNPLSAIATNKLSALAGSTTSSIVFIKNKFYYLKSLLPSIISAAIGSAFGSYLAILVDEKILRLFLIFATPVIALFILFKGDFGDYERDDKASSRKTIVLCAIASFVIGMYDGFFGPAAGTFFIISYIALGGLSLNESMGNAKIVNMVTNISSALVYLRHGAVVFSLALPATIFIILGNLIGSRLAVKKGNKIVKPVMLIVLAILLIKLISDAF